MISQLETSIYEGFSMAMLVITRWYMNIMYTILVAHWLEVQALVKGQALVGSWGVLCVTQRNHWIDVVWQWFIGVTLWFNGGLMVV